MKLKILCATTIALGLFGCQSTGSVRVLDAHYISPAHAVAEPVKGLAKNSTIKKNTSDNRGANKAISSSTNFGVKKTNTATRQQKNTGSSSGYSKLAFNSSAEPTVAAVPKSKNHPPMAISLPTWTAEKGHTLRENLRNWGRKEGWDIAWDANVDYPIESSLIMKGDFLSAIEKIIGLYEKADRPLYASAYSSQKLIVITDKKGQL